METKTLPLGLPVPNLMDHPAAILCIVIFVAVYAAVLLEEKIHMRKSKPVILGAGLIWATIALMANSLDSNPSLIHDAVFHALGEFAALMLFLLAAMTFIGALQEQRVFDAMRAKMVSAGLSLRQIFWVTGIAAFFLSPLADNMTTALVLGTVVMAVGRNDAKFISIACINVVCAANAGGAFSPFGDITTLMVWQAGNVEFFEFFALFIPSVVCFLVPAVIMGSFVPKERPRIDPEVVTLKRGSKGMIALGLMTIVMAVSFEQFLHLPAFMGMMTGLSLLMIYSWYLKSKKEGSGLDIIQMVEQSEWDTLLFFFGIIFCVSGLSFIGYLDVASTVMYEDWGATYANIAVGFASAIIDNIPVMFAVLSMNPDMDHFQWLLVTLTGGVGGSLLSIGSAAGVALMGVARGHYTFFGHLKWAPVILLGYAAAIGTHFLVNAN